MNDTSYPIWFLGKDDDLICQHLGTQDVAMFHDLQNWQQAPLCQQGSSAPISRHHGPAPSAGSPVHPHEQGPSGGQLAIKRGVKTFKLGTKLYSFVQMASRFTFDGDGRLLHFHLNKVKESWQWKSIRYEGSHGFRVKFRTPIIKGVDWRKRKFKHLDMHHQTFSANSPEAKKLGVSLCIFDKAGLWKGAKKDLKWALVEMGAIAVWKVYEGFSTGQEWEPLREYIFDRHRLWDLSTAVVKGAITSTVVAALLAGVTVGSGGVAIIPIAAGVVISIAVGFLVDFAFAEMWRWLTEQPVLVPH